MGGSLTMSTHRLNVLGLEMSLTELHRKKSFKTGMVIIIASLKDYQERGDSNGWC